jgi:hypothetical protein
VAEDRKHFQAFLNIIMNISREFLDQLNHYQLLKKDWSVKLGLKTCLYDPVDCL